jgi:hypothetical protein
MRSAIDVAVSTRDEAPAINTGQHVTAIPTAETRTSPIDKVACALFVDSYLSSHVGDGSAPWLCSSRR